MKLLRRFPLIALASTLLGGNAAQAAVATVAATGAPHSSDPLSLLPLGLFFITAVFVYLCNRPRGVVVYARARRRSNGARRVNR